MAGTGYQAGGNVTPKSIVVLSTSAVAGYTTPAPPTPGFQVILASGATVPMVGISGRSTRWMQLQAPPTAPSISNPNDTYHAVAGENCQVYQIGDVAPLILGGTVTAGDLITSDGSGHGITAGTDGQWYVGQALESGVAGVEIPIRIQPGCRGA